MKKVDCKTPEESKVLLGRKLARALSEDDLKAVSGGEGLFGRPTFAPTVQGVEYCDDGL